MALSDTLFAQVVATAITSLKRYNLPVSNRTLNLVVQQALKYVGKRRLRELDDSEFQTVNVLVDSWYPDQAVLRKLKFDVVRCYDDIGRPI